MNRQDDIKKAVEVMKNGGVILYPTDTVWGIGCDATNAEAVAKVYKIKQRDDSKALICLVDSDARLQRYVRNAPEVAWNVMELATKPTTVIFDEAVNLAHNLIAEDGSIAMRITNEEFSKELCYRFQKPIVSTSANISGQPAAQNYFRDKMTAAGFDIKPTQSAICAVMLYDAKLSQIYATRMQEEGIYVTGFYYPVVPKDQARIRVQISAGHEKEHLDKCIAAFIKVGKELGVLK